MEKEQPQLDILKKYLKLLLNRYRLIAACVLLAVSAGIFVYLYQPEIYQSSASIMYQEQKITPSKFSQDSKQQMQEMVNTISQQVLSRTNLEKVIKEFNLYAHMRQNLPIEDVIERMRENHVEISLHQGKGNVFSVAFKGRDPRTVMRVTNSLASKFIEENLRIREEQARERASYIQDELRMAKERLNKKEAQMRDYKLKHYNEMPQQRSANMSRLNALQEQYSSLQTNIYNLEQTRMLVAEQLEVRRKQQEAAADGEEGGSATRTGQSSRAQKLAAARSRLQDLMSRYTPQHPEVKRLERRIEQLKSGQNSGQEQSGQEPAENNGKMSALIGQDKRIGELAAQLKEIDVNLKTLRREAENIREQMKKYQRWIDAAPEREAEWASLTRDYEELKQYHDELLSRSLAAEAAESLEVRQKGSQFKVIDSAYLPRTPIKGTFLKILMLSLFAGAAAGGGLVVTLDFLDTSFKESQEVESTLQLPVTCALPLIVTEAEKKRERIKSIIWSLFFSAWAMALAATVVYFWQQGDILI